MQKLSQKTQGIVYVLIAAFGFSLMSMFIKLAGDLPSFEKAFFRNFVALIFITILMLRSRTSFQPERRNLPALFGRCFFGTLGLLCNFYAIGKLIQGEGYLIACSFRYQINALTTFFTGCVGSTLNRDYRLTFAYSFAADIGR